MEWNWTFNIENKYPHQGWDYWTYHFFPTNWEVEDHWVERGRAYYSERIRPDKRAVKLRAHTKKVHAKKEIELFIGCFSYETGVVKSQRVTFTVKESDALIPHWHYYCNNDYMADSFYDEKSFRIFIDLKADGELEIAYNEIKS